MASDKSESNDGLKFTRIPELRREIEKAIDAKQFEQLPLFIQELTLLVTMPDLPKFVQENGNGFHWLFTAIGHSAIEHNRLDLAKFALVRSANVPPSPQLSSFGPTMSLAKRMLELGEVDSVKSFLKASLDFWDLGQTSVTRWLEQLERDGNTNLDMLA